MKDQHLLACASISAAKHTDAMKKAIQAIPKDGGREIDELLRVRTSSCSNGMIKRQWSVVAVRSQEKFPYSSKKWGKDPSTTNWLVTIRGETVNSAERYRPYRREDPWRQRESYRERSFSPRRRPYRESRNRVIEVIPRHRRGLLSPPLGDAVNEKPQTGTLVVAKLMSQSEAEEKMEKIWVEMTKGAYSEMAS